MKRKEEEEEEEEERDEEVGVQHNQQRFTHAHILW